MVDIHCHILPNMDDGAKNLEEALRLAKQAVEQGISTVIATPHHNDGKYFCLCEEVLMSCEQLNDYFNKNNVALRILPGQEVHFFQDIIEEYDHKKLLTLAQSRYILIELPSNYLPDNYEFIFHELLVMGIIPIIAHPERNAVLLENLEIVNELIEMGVLFQLTSASLMGKFGSKIQKQSLKWCKEGYVHFIASDAHNLSTRPFDLKKGYEVIKNKLGQEYVEYLIGNSEKLVRDIEIEGFSKKSKKGFLFWQR